MAAKSKTAFFCQQCGFESPKWQGKCPSCNQWNTFVEEVVERQEPKEIWKEEKPDKRGNKPILLDEIAAGDVQRIVTIDLELNRTLGGGIVPGSLILVGGEPGIGKSTLLLQLALELRKIKVLYVSGEESEQQIKMRAERLKGKNPELFISTEVSIGKLFTQIKNLEPGLVIIDSIQTLISDFVDATAGSIAQIKECAGQLQRYAKESNVPVFILSLIHI